MTIDQLLSDERVAKGMVPTNKKKTKWRYEDETKNRVCWQGRLFKVYYYIPFGPINCPVMKVHGRLTQASLDGTCKCHNMPDVSPWYT